MNAPRNHSSRQGAYRTSGARGSLLVVQTPRRHRALVVTGYALLIVAFVILGSLVYAACDAGVHDIVPVLYVLAAAVPFSLWAAFTTGRDAMYTLILDIGSSRLVVRRESFFLRRVTEREYEWDDASRLDVEGASDGDGSLYWVRLVRSDIAERLFRYREADGARLVKSFANALAATELPTFAVPPGPTKGDDAPR